ncbi:MAG: class I SAM-dependent methyltransferase [Planctomycetaceae bacterium]|nr:class I SAM-dependent methyltransferase [Planctomycetaceae bacterium]
MGLYSKYVLPRLQHLACGTRPIARQREKVVPHAEGRVLEIGMGTGLNLPYYDRDKVTKLWGLEPAAEMRQRAKQTARALDMEVEILDLPGEQIPLDDASVDTVLVTYTLCTIVDVERALRGMARVLRPEGKLIFCEHGAAPDVSVRRWQNRINPVWKRFAGGCNVNRPIPSLIEDSGFQIDSLETMYLPGFRTLSYNYWGTAGVVRDQ